MSHAHLTLEERIRIELFPGLQKEAIVRRAACPEKTKETKASLPLYESAHPDCPGR